MGVVCGVSSGYDSITAVQCIIWRVVCAGYGGGNVWCARGRVCAVYEGAVGVVCGVCSGYDGCSVTGVQCTIWRVVYAVYGGCSVWVVCVHRVPCVAHCVVGTARVVRGCAWCVECCA